MIEVRQVNKKFENGDKEISVLKDISFFIKSQEFVSVLGPSGCGKTTLLNIIAGLEEPTSGQIFINKNIISTSGLDRGIVFQESPLFPWKTVWENIKLSLEVKGTDPQKTDSVILEYLKRVDLLDFAHFYPRDLSGGMRQRAALARTLALGSNVLLMDEPFGALDAQTRILMQEELLDILKNQKKTVLFVTHNIDEAIFLSDRIVVLSSLPAKIIKMIEINLPRPRRQDLISLKEFYEIKMEIWDLLKRENVQI